MEVERRKMREPRQGPEIERLRQVLIDIVDYAVDARW